MTFLFFPAGISLIIKILVAKIILIE